jgi:YidC/Oxa1 family membrane protein insertase
MDKRTIIAIVLSVVIIIAAFAIQALLFPPGPPDESSQIPASQVDGAVGETEGEAQRDVKKISPLLGEEREVVARNIPFSTNVFEGSFSTRGGNMTSIKLKNYTEGENSQVEMIISGESGRYPFNIILDEYDTGNDMFTYKKSLLGNEYEFALRYVYTKNGKEIPFTLVLLSDFWSSNWSPIHKARSKSGIQKVYLLCRRKEKRLHQKGKKRPQRNRG